MGYTTGNVPSQHLLNPFPSLVSDIREIRHDFDAPSPTARAGEKHLWTWGIKVLAVVGGQAGECSFQARAHAPTKRLPRLRFLKVDSACCAPGFGSAFRIIPTLSGCVAFVVVCCGVRRLSGISVLPELVVRRGVCAQQ